MHHYVIDGLKDNDEELILPIPGKQLYFFQGALQ
jgi:hypothetical protein